MLTAEEVLQRKLFFKLINAAVGQVGRYSVYLLH